MQPQNYFFLFSCIRVESDIKKTIFFLVNLPNISIKTLQMFFFYALYNCIFFLSIFSSV